MRRTKPMSQQVIVITGASSGIGRATARMAAERGARVVLAARNAVDLADAVDQIQTAGGRAAYVTADVGDPEQVELIAMGAIAEFGAIDTWVNNAGVSIYGRLMDVEVSDMRRQFDVNFWGTVYGSRAAIRHLRQSGGTLINVASAAADRAIPLQGAYAASKHAVKAFTDALRMELEEEGVPVAVSLVKPGSIATPLFEKARTLLAHEPQPIPPVYAPEVAAAAILECAERPVRELVVGGMGKVLSLMEKNSFEAQSNDVPVTRDREDNLYFPVEHDGGEQGRNWSGRTRRTSVYTWAALHPARVAVAVTLASLGLAALFNRYRT